MKKFRPREIGEPAQPGGGANSSRLGGTKTGADFSAARTVFNSIEPMRKSFCLYRNIPKLPASVGGSRGRASRSSASRRVLVVHRQYLRSLSEILIKKISTLSYALQNDDFFWLRLRRTVKPIGRQSLPSLECRSDL